MQSKAEETPAPVELQVELNRRCPGRFVVKASGVLGADNLTLPVLMSLSAKFSALVEQPGQSVLLLL